MTLKHRIRKALIEYSIDFDGADGFKRNIRTLRASFIRDGRMHAYAMKFKTPRGYLQRAVFDMRVKFFQWYVKLRQEL